MFLSFAILTTFLTLTFVESNEGNRGSEEWSQCSFYIDRDLPRKWTDVRDVIVARSRGRNSAARNVARCKQPTDACAALWTVIEVNSTSSNASSFSSNATSTKRLLLQGCYDQNRELCSKNECVSDRDIGRHVGHRGQGAMLWCCCGGPLCNRLDRLVHRPLIGRSFVPTNPISSNNIDPNVLALIIITLLIVLMIALTGCYWLRRNKCANNSFFFFFSSKLLFVNWNCLERGNLLHISPLSSTRQPQANSYGESNINLENLQLVEMIGRGRFGTVYSAKTDNDNYNGEKGFAVKVYDRANEAYFCNEAGIYRLASVIRGHPNLLRFFGTVEAPFRRQNLDATIDDKNEGKRSDRIERRQYWLVTELCTEGSLQDYLKTNEIDFGQFCNLACSVVSGLSFLHSEERSDGRIVKPVIAHRDVNSRNVLVKRDGSAVICDLGLAIQLDRDHIAGQELRLAEVGTKRYMAPEVLEGAVNLHDPVSALMQADVYSVGLVLWEIFSRCKDVYSLAGMTVADYCPPYSEWCLSGATLEQMQMIVCKKRMRPLFPRPCHTSPFDVHPVLRAICNFISDCWEGDPEGRATIACTEMRFGQLRRANPQLLANGVTVTKQMDQSEQGSESPSILQPLQDSNFIQPEVASSDNDSNRSNDEDSTEEEEEETEDRDYGIRKSRLLNGTRFGHKIDPNDPQSFLMEKHLKRGRRESNQSLNNDQLISAGRRKDTEQALTIP